MTYHTNVGLSRSRRHDKAMARLAARRGGATVVRPRPMSCSPTVTVVIPCYNYGRYLEDSVASVLSQTGVIANVLVVDDASTDDSADAAERLRHDDPRVRVISHRRNLGHIATYNEGLEAVDSQYTILLSADDLLVPGALARATALMECYPDVGMVYGRAVSFTDSAIPVPRTAVTYWSIWPGSIWLRRRFSLGQNTIFTPAVVARTEVQRRIGGYNARLPHSGDLEMWLRFATGGDIGFIGGAEQAFYRLHGSNMSATTYSNGVVDIRQRHAAFCDVLPRVPIAGRAALAALSARALATRALELAGESHRAGDEPGAATYAALALATYPKARRLAAWRAVHGQATSADLIRKAVGMTLGRIRNHFMWEQTHWYGG